MTDVLPSIRQPPPFLDQAVLKIISFHDRRDPISRSELVARVAVYPVEERVVREQIKQEKPPIRNGVLAPSITGSPTAGIPGMSSGFSTCIPRADSIRACSATPRKAKQNR